MHKRTVLDYRQIKYYFSNALSHYAYNIEYRSSFAKTLSEPQISENWFLFQRGYFGMGNGKMKPEELQSAFLTNREKRLLPPLT